MTKVTINVHPRTLERICNEIKACVTVEKVNYLACLEEAEEREIS